jgi:hypothetical protein
MVLGPRLGTKLIWDQAHNLKAPSLQSTRIDLKHRTLNNIRISHKIQPYLERVQLDLCGPRAVLVDVVACRGLVTYGKFVPSLF